MRRHPQSPYLVATLHTPIRSTLASEKCSSVEGRTSVVVLVYRIAILVYRIAVLVYRIAVLVCGIAVLVYGIAALVCE